MYIFQFHKNNPYLHRAVYKYKHNKVKGVKNLLEFLPIDSSGHQKATNI